MCIFCDIIEGKIPSKKIYEDDQVYAMLDISQTTRGHSLVLSKTHYDNFLQMPNEEFGYMMKVAQNLTKDITDKLKANGCNIIINTNEAAGQTVNHVHVHIIPRYDQNDSVEIKYHPNQFDLDEILNELK